MSVQEKQGHKPGAEKELNALDIAKYILHFGYEHGELITNLKLQKLLYYVHRCLATYNKPLFKNDFEARVHGPVIPAIYRFFRRYQYKPITDSAFTLESRTHREAPWMNARQGLPEDERSTNIIKKDDIRDYFKQFFEK